MTVILKSINEIVSRASQLRTGLQAHQYSPKEAKELKRRYSIKDAAKIAKRSTQTIRDAEGDGRLPKATIKPGTNRRVDYKIEEVHHMQEVFNTGPRRNPAEDEPIILAIQNFKGGVGKSTTSVLMAQYFAQAGYNTLLVDCDPQASSTNQFGYISDVDIEIDDTLYPYFAGEQTNLRYAIKDTYWPKLKLIPANLQLYGADFMLFSRAQNKQEDGRQIYHWLRDGLSEIAQDFDIIIIDPPPALSMISLNVLYAANAAIIPIQPGMLDFYSTEQYFTTLMEVFESIKEDVDYHFMKLMICRKKSIYIEAGKRQAKNQVTPQDDITDMTRECFGDYVLDNIFYESAEIERAIALGYSLYEINGPTSTSRNTYNRAIKSIDLVCQEVEELIHQAWPSYVRRAQHQS